MVTGRRYRAFVASAVPLGDRLRDLRTEAGLTLSQLSERSGVSVSYLNDIEHGRTVPSLGRLQDIAVALGLNASSLLVGTTPYGEDMA